MSIGCSGQPTIIRPGLIEKTKTQDRQWDPGEGHSLYSLAVVPSSPVKNSAVVFKKVGFKELLSPSFLIPASLSHRTLKERNPQILARGFSRRLNVGLKSSCSTLS